jgi:cysteine desulfurase
MHFYTTHLEHTSIVEIVKNNPTGNPTFFIDNNERGEISTQDLYNKLAKSYNSGAKTLVSVSIANSEIGVIQDIGSIANIVHDFGGILHVDATQIYPWERINVQELGIDLMSVSGQKMHCPKGIGFLFVRDGIKLKPMIFGSQQNGRRAGTYPTHLIAAFGKALEITRKNNAYNKVNMLRNRLLEQLSIIPSVKLNGPNLNENRLCNNISLTIDGVKADTLVTMCDLLGVVIAKGSACKSYEPKPSETLLAIGLRPERALNTIRISLDEFNTEENITAAADIITKLVTRIREEKS